MPTKVKKNLVSLRLNSLVDEWYVEMAVKFKMNKSELMRKVLSDKMYLNESGGMSEPDS